MTRINRTKIAVIGAGWAGCAAAIELAKNGHEVHAFEAARTMGGRARQVAINGLMLDNGQHILLGAYRATLKLLKTIGVNPNAALLRLPLQMCYPDNSGGMHFVAPKLPAPWHMFFALLTAKGMRRADKMALARFSSAARWMDWQLNDDCSVAELLDRFDQTPYLIDVMWQPLCIAALNTPIEVASAQVFLNVLKDSLGARRNASDMLIARTDLTTLFAQPAADFVQQHGGKIFTGCAVQEIVAINTNQQNKQQIKQQWQITLKNQTPQYQNDLLFDGVVIATSAENARHLVAPLLPLFSGSDEAKSVNPIPVFDYQPITTCYLQYPATIQLDRPFYALKENPSNNAFGQFVFDRGQFCTLDDVHQKGLLAVVISTSQAAIAQGHEQLAAACAAQLASAFNRPDLACPQWHQIITEKRATFACTPNLHRPANLLPLKGVVIAGDYTQSRYPATLEAAVQSGLGAAALLIKNSNK